MFDSSFSSVVHVTTLADILPDNYIDGKEFCKLTEAEVKAMVPPIGLAKKIVHLISKVITFRQCVQKHAKPG